MYLSITLPKKNGKRWINRNTLQSFNAFAQEYFGFPKLKDLVMDISIPFSRVPVHFINGVLYPGDVLPDGRTLVEVPLSNYIYDYCGHCHDMVQVETDHNCNGVPTFHCSLEWPREFLEKVAGIQDYGFKDVVTNTKSVYMPFLRSVRQANDHMSYFYGRDPTSLSNLDPKLTFHLDICTYKLSHRTFYRMFYFWVRLCTYRLRMTQFGLLSYTRKQLKTRQKRQKKEVAERKRKRRKKDK
jgi:hypothetical protein